ncbi:MAG: hypothetical protein Q7P63_13735 [Verrucomicrobiota bacterium JB022]|nr:hypothetical protein [Verrucomicrobiota bacterium JB022]
MILLKNKSHGLRAVALLALFLGPLVGFTGCETTGGDNAESGRSSVGQTSQPLNLLDTMYAARTAMTSLADGSASNPQEAMATVANAYPRFSEFANAMQRLSRSFDSADPTEFWQKLSEMGSIYQINYIGHSSGELRRIQKNSLRSLRVEIADLQRQVEIYGETYAELLAAVGTTPTVEAYQQNIPTINLLTQQSVALDKELRDFSTSLSRISSYLQGAGFSGAPDW